MAKGKLSSSLRTSIQASLDAAEEARKRDMFKRRLDLAKAGLAAFKTNKPIEALRSFVMYLDILEQWKRVPEGKLSPALFDARVDAGELLIISGVYWDLVKIYDHSRSARTEEKFQHYLSQYIAFSKGMVFEALSAETMRKYIRTRKVKHRAALKQAYVTISGSNCFVATYMMDVTDPQTRPRLTRFRDEILGKRSLGRLLIRFYYRVGPKLALLTETLPEGLRLGLGRSLDAFGRFSARRFRSESDGRRNPCSES